MAPPTSVDVAVVGAGPVGCAAALSVARRGARVLLLEADPRAANRLAGEWLHPAGVRVLERLGLGPALAAAGYPGRGFVVFPDDGSAPVVLDYADGSRGLSCEHGALVELLRRSLATQPAICYLPFARATGLAGHSLGFTRVGGASGAVRAALVVGADGRASAARRWLGRADVPATRLSSMAGLILEDAELPFEGFGHVMLGGPGPMLVYRLGPRRLRACLDVPPGFHLSTDAPAGWEPFALALPTALRPAFRRAVIERRIAWAATQHRPRTDWGRAELALTGDAVGSFHPLTAVGLTLGLLDAEALARARGPGAYRRERAAESRVAALLATALYDVFTRRDPGTTALRQAVYHTWRRDPTERRATMRLLSGDDTSLASFARAFLRVTGQALHDVAVHSRDRDGRGHTLESLARLAEWLRWLAVSTAGGPIELPRIGAAQEATARRADRPDEAGQPPRQR